MPSSNGLIIMWEYWLMFALGLGVTVAALFFGFRHLYLSRLIENLPTSTVSHAQQGYVELHGSAGLPESGGLKGPLSDSDCCWYRYSIEKRSGRNWRTVEKGESPSGFLLRDQTGECVVQPAGAQVQTAAQDVWHGSRRHPAIPTRSEDPKSLLGTIGKVLNTDIGLGARYRYREERIHEGDSLYAVGHFKTLDEIDLKQRQERSQRQLLREWKDDQENLLSRFDANRDGTIDPREWELVRQAARRKSALQQRREIRTIVPHTLSAEGSGMRPFLISNQPEFALIRNYRRRAILALLIFFAAGAVSLWILANRPGV